MAEKGEFLNETLVATGNEQLGAFVSKTSVPLQLQKEGPVNVLLKHVKAFIVTIILLIIVAAIIFTALGQTTTLFSQTGQGHALVNRNVWGGTSGNPPIGEETIISATTSRPSEEDWWKWPAITWGGIPDASTVIIATNNNDSLHISGTRNNMTVTTQTPPTTTGTFTPSLITPFTDYADNTPIDLNYQLNNSFLVECVSGSCEVGTYFIVSKEQIYGKTL